MKKTVMMKKRVGVLLGAVLLAASIPMSAVMAKGRTKTVDHKDGQAYLYMYLDFQEAPLWLRDKIWCNIGLYGKDWAATSTKYILKSDTKNIKAGVKLYYGNQSDKYDGLKAGYGGSYAKVSGKYGKTDYSLKAYDN